jgi:hypothetical protein
MVKVQIFTQSKEKKFQMFIVGLGFYEIIDLNIISMAR